MELSERWMEKFEQEGFANVYEWQDEPNATYPSHTHRGKVSVFITDGSLAFRFADQTRTVTQNERYDIPVGVQHTITIGKHGCISVIGEEIEGDSQHN